MGVRITFDGSAYEAANYSSSEDSSPLSSSDTSGGIGSFSVDLPAPTRSTDPRLLAGPEYLIGAASRIADTRGGFTVGRVDGAGEQYDGGVQSFTGVSRLSLLNIYNVQAQPYIGTLGGAFEYYLSLAGVTTDWSVDASITARSVVLPGFNGELWLRLKQLAAAQDCDISLVSGIILLRPIRARVATGGRDLSRGVTTNQASLARTVEVYWYDSTEITDELVYPIGGWQPETEVLNVNAGETAEYTLELSASLSAIQTPVMETYVASDYSASSVYTIVADDGLPVSSAQWAAGGGSVVVTLDPDTVTLNVVLTGATGIGVATGGDSKAFSLALAADTTGSRYSTLRIVGTGVAYTREKKTFRTGVPDALTATDVGETIDNPFLTTLNELYRAGVRAAARYSGPRPTLTGTVTAVNRRGYTNVNTYTPYATVQAALVTAIGGTPTYAQVKTHYLTTLALTSYADVQAYWFATVVNDFANQVFGNVQGARIYDAKRHRWFRIRSATIGPESISIDSADDDHLYGDCLTAYGTSTYATVQTARGSMNYQQDRLAGAYV